MSLEISHLLHAPGELIRFELEMQAPDASRDDMEIRSVRIEGQLTYVGEQIAVFGQIHAEGAAHCARCVKAFDTSFEAPLEAVFRRKGEEGAGAMDEDDPDIEFFEGSAIELEKVVVSALSLHMPMRFLCGEDCLGLCPVCGQNLNESSCDCVPSGEDSPFAALKALLNKEKEVDPNGSPEG